jgi:hypothetical protein
MVNDMKTNKNKINYSFVVKKGFYILAFLVLFISMCISFITVLLLLCSFILYLLGLMVNNAKLKVSIAKKG